MLRARMGAAPRWLPLCAAILCCPVYAAAAPRARTLREWIGAMKINVPSGYSEEFSGVRVKVSDMSCEDLVVGHMRAEYVPPTALHFAFEGIEAECEGDYDWKYDAWVGNVKGDGKVRAEIHRTAASLDVVIDVDAWGAPTELRTRRCDLDLRVEDVALRGDPIGDAANVFVDAFTDWFLADIEDFVCASLKEYVYADVGALVRDAGLQNCACCDRDDGVAASARRRRRRRRDEPKRGATIARERELLRRTSGSRVER